ncbi:MAG TPA: branched-chain amino acid ABC transporter permease, partial [Kiloniellaceae bacterium]|nr:branched-chain amino acid ABC transporter permease [Kiloniellaceae bacterium]
MRRFVERHTFWALVILIVGAVFLWLIFAVWPEWLQAAFGRKKTFVNTLLNGITLGGLYFLVASGFTLVFGLMRNVNLAHGSMYLLGAYIGYEVADASGSWFLGLAVAFLAIALSGVLLQVLIFRHMAGDDLRQTLVTIGISIIAADLMLAIWTGTTYQFEPPEWLFGATELPIVSVVKSSGAAVYIKYPVYRLTVLAVAVGVGVALWLFLNRTKLGMMIRAGVNDREMLSASGVNVQLVFA